jgi:hypothetical protein
MARATSGILAALIPAICLGMSAPAMATSKTGAAVGGLIAGIAIGAAVSSAVNHPKTVYVPSPPKPKPSPNGFSPKPGVTCYPAVKACYNTNGSYNANWTWKVYAKK